MKVLKWLREENKWLVVSICVIAALVFSGIAIIQDIKYAELIERLSKLLEDVAVVV